MATIARTRPAPRSLARRLAARRVAGYLLVLPAVLYVLALIGFPLGLGVWYSLTDTTVATPGRFVGLANFVDVAGDPTFRLAVRNTLVIGVVATAAKITLSVLLAFLMLGAFPGRGLLRTLFVLPWTIPIGLSTIAFKWMFDSQFSVVNWVLVHAGLIERGPNWLGTMPAAMTAVIFVSTWRAVPFGAITVLAGLTTIPAEIIEAARIDGATWWQRFRAIIMPIIAPILFIALLFDLIFTLTELTVVYVLTGGGPVDQTQVLANYALQIGVYGGQLGQGAAVALYLLPALLVLTVLSLRNIARREGL
ncbi:MAG TPA: sugar ABC transporter permease [Chloroflexota bacterium]|nr:sugar ABC transporter permease [Chloroflexota bacterium]